MHSSLANYAVLIACLISLPAQAKLYKWVDSQGITHYGETIPAEYADRNRTEIDKAGRILKRTDIATPAERQTQAAQEAKNKAAADADRAQKLHDKSLLNTYSNVKEIELSRQRNTQQVDIRIESTTKQLAEANRILLEAQKKITPATKQAIDTDTQDDVREAQTVVNNLTSKLDEFKQEKARLESRFATDLLRYKELTGQ